MRLIEIRVLASCEAGLHIEGLPEDRMRTTADRVRAAVLNSGLLQEIPALRVRLDPSVRGEGTSALDLPIALATLVGSGVIGPGLRWILASGRLGLDGVVYAPGLDGRPRLADVVRNLCQTPVVESERTFDWRLS